jgi:protein phosphatase 1G
MFDFCMAPDTSGDGTGCDNMTCIIITFDKLLNNEQSERSAKRKATSDSEDAEQQDVKKSKADPENAEKDINKHSDLG